MVNIKKIEKTWHAAVCLIMLAWGFTLSAAPAQNAVHENHQGKVNKVLFIGDSMTGWLSERLNAYGENNGFEVATVIWDGSTISKWGNSPKLARLIEEQNPDAVFLSLGMNELFEANPSKLHDEVSKIKEAIGDRPFVWVGPPSWPGYDKGKILNDWLEKELGEESFFRSFNLKLPRQSAKNPHPTREGMVEWMDAVVNWLPDHSSVHLDTTNTPPANHMSRGKTFIYKRMKETL